MYDILKDRLIAVTRVYRYSVKHFWADSATQWAKVALSLPSSFSMLHAKTYYNWPIFTKLLKKWLSFDYYRH